MLLCKEIIQPGVPTSTMRNIEASNQLAVAGGIVLIASLVLMVLLVRRGWTLPAVVPNLFGLFLMTFHPTWVVRTDGGDCGVTRVMLSWAVVALLGLILVLQIGLLWWHRGSLGREQEDYGEGHR